VNFSVVFNRRNLEKGLVFQSINVFKCVGPLFATESTHSLDIIKVKERIVLHETTDVPHSVIPPNRGRFIDPKGLKAELA